MIQLILIYTMMVVDNLLNLILAVLVLWGAIHATVQSTDAFVAFAHRSKQFWMIVLWLGVVFTLGAGIYSLARLLVLLGAGIPAALLTFASVVPGGNFFGILLFVLPGTYFAGDYRKVRRFNEYKRGKGAFRQRPGNPYGDPRGPRDW